MDQKRTSENTRCPRCGREMQEKALYWDPKRRDYHARCICECGWRGPMGIGVSIIDAYRAAKAAARVRAKRRRA